MLLTTIEGPLQQWTASPATLSVTVLPFGMTKDISSEKTGKFTLKAKVRYHCHLCPPPSPSGDDVIFEQRLTQILDDLSRSFGVRSMGLKPVSETHLYRLN